MPLRTFITCWPPTNLPTSSVTPLATTGVGINFSTSGYNFEYYNGYSFQAVYTGGTSGYAYLQGSNNAVDYSPITATTAFLVGAGNYLWNVAPVKYKYAKMNWVAAGSSTGSMTVYVMGKE